ncbi:MAG: hypothetical protein MRY83_08045, partial [Flavobacteriales bacterium]|nr:hypothetical protein [Flavobacteriales bacterium]
MEKRFKYLFFIIFMFCALSTKAQDNNDTLDTSTKTKLLKPFLNLDARRSYFLGEWVRMGGLRIGVEYYEKYRFGLGAYNSARVQLPNYNGAPENSLVSVGFSYSTIFFEYVFKRNYRWEISAPILWGTGVADLSIQNQTSEIDTTFTTPRIPVIST